jgi:hypothetical protein
MGVAAGVSAAQLGAGYGLKIVAWLPEEHEASRVTWLASLAWVVWIAATSTVVGALVASWLGQRGDAVERSGLTVALWRISLALSAGVGALATAPLAAIPARLPRSDNFAPEWTVAGYAVVGVVIGLLVAVAVLSARAITANVVASMVYLWLLAIVTVVNDLRHGAVQPLARLALWEFSQGPIVRDYYVPGVLVLVLVPFVIGIFASLRAGLRGDGRVGVAISGAVGPLIVAAAYLLAAPRFVGGDSIDRPLWSAYLFAPYAVIMGLAGSVLAAALGDRTQPGPLLWWRRRPVGAGPGAVSGAESDLDHTGGDHADEDGDGHRTDADDLDDWPAAVRNAGATSTDTTRTSALADPDRELADDAYAPPRAYRRKDSDLKAYATDDLDPPTTEATPTAPVKATGRAKAKPPVWPTGPTGSPGEEPEVSPRN